MCPSPTKTPHYKREGTDRQVSIFALECRRAGKRRAGRRAGSACSDPTSTVWGGESKVDHS